jgi:hypothetical protein
MRSILHAVRSPVLCRPLPLSLPSILSHQMPLPMSRIPLSSSLMGTNSMRSQSSKSYGGPEIGYRAPLQAAILDWSGIIIEIAIAATDAVIALYCICRN